MPKPLNCAFRCPATPAIARRPRSKSRFVTDPALLNEPWFKTQGFWQTTTLLCLNITTSASHRGRCLGTRKSNTKNARLVQWPGFPPEAMVGCMGPC
jgi:hypothetical protein